MGVELAAVSEEEVRAAVAEHTGVSQAQVRIEQLEVRPASDSPLGFLGDHFRISVSVRRHQDGQLNHLNYFGKSLPCKNLSHYDYTVKTGAFYKEIELYKTLFRDMADAMTPGKHPIKWLPAFYYARGAELFILEDLSLDGFYMYPVRTVLDLEHSEKAIEVMAVMHAASFIFEEKFKLGKAKTRSNKYKPGANIGDLYPNLTFETEASDIKGHPGNTFWEAGFRSQKGIIDLFPDYTDEQQQVIKDNIEDKLRGALRYVKASNRFRNALLHGDLWANNYLFRKNSQDQVTDAIIIDFQLARYAPPANDLLMFLYLTNTRAFRQQHQTHLLHLYYTRLAHELQAEELDIESILPEKEFVESVEYYREYAMLNNVMYFQTILNPPDICATYLESDQLFASNMYQDRSAMMRACYRQDQVYRDRMTEAMRELAEFYNWV